MPRSTCSTRSGTAGGQPRQRFGTSKDYLWGMNPHDSHFFAPPITEVPDYVWARRHDTPKDTGRWISHPNAEAALQAAKKACRHHPGRWYGRSTIKADAAEFLVYEGIKVVEHQVVDG